ncbi:orotate phosphoribosyltransferase [Saccharibacillus sp. CPCC 101409]|uniref:orotate phosphoribosyltransferase n=1 Tax=Saccharibacillus sp. CPCC 101409 TaxID=3058041 RepID=UPI0026723C2A|nr:orotate phosphoribosyltransferase [Saccharibacillus sp. CPCC 101409]MDO3409233.1 orotate phosphoribosyltransferase [Saccharibacillus sp. CPCC 101409]
MSIQTTTENKIAADLLKIGAVALRPEEPFTWTSGIKSPIYCDNRLTMAYPEVRERIAESFAQLIRERYPDAEVIAGTATAGIPHAAWVAQKLNLPMAYIRDKAKGHGKQNQIEGSIKAGQKVVVIEDLISTGGSSLKAALAVREAGAQPLAVLAIFSYQLDRAESAFAEEGVPLATLSNYTALMQTALELGTIQESQIELLKSWREDPSAFGR